ncbi:poly-gamma-glutamate synthase PgsB [Luteibaculum oceani]|uniref:Poly-gamma-glutamate synthase PgsB n=1 Tax=Luteibaculum oceani TaxID=1294296 RepID=A0A5C6UZN9_9FLAO|nr:poly-gamma-glutamate synthase PgsB [Luteibaculum oceani]TXC76115.1 poly-gamma-glutamate synthase PgsB [Luteibaculum oceani]
MVNLIFIVLITVSLLVYGVLEYQRHQFYLRKIPIRIHVNGTRGKSSVTRLVGAGLRAGGLKTLTKVTGTFPRLVSSDGTEVAIHRKAGANILEQLDIVKYCAKNNYDVLLIECMALQPIYQKITEHQMIKATHGVITNIRLDHLDVMGPRLENVAEAISNTVPKNSKLYTAEDRFGGLLTEKSKKRNSEIYFSDLGQVSQQDMKGFTYLEHASNVALALDICEDLGVDKTVALEAMKKSVPDEGVLRKYEIDVSQKKIVYYNGLAANDIESSIMIWKNISSIEDFDAGYLLLNGRKDRKDRTISLLSGFSSVALDGLIICGDNVELSRSIALKHGFLEDKVHVISSYDPEVRFNQIMEFIASNSMIFSVGNMGAGGAEMSEYFAQKRTL